MFTGIVELKGEIRDIVRLGESARLAVDIGELVAGTKIGDSIAIDGVCLTVTELQGSLATFDAVKETLDRTALGNRQSRDLVNVERSLRLTDRLGGHLVTGHIDGVGRISRKVQTPGQCEIWVEVDGALADMMIPKGSIAIDGISLTIVQLVSSSFSVAVIPHSLEVTTLGLKSVGDPVNIETDLIGKWIRKLLQSAREETETKDITEEMLREKGFL